MICPVCKGGHSFDLFGTQGNVQLVYSAPARASKTPISIECQKIHLNMVAGRPWIWIIDFAQMENRHYISMDLTRKLIGLINTDHNSNLTAIYIIHPNFWLRNTFTLLKHLISKQLYPKIRLFEGKEAGLLLELGSAGIEYKWLAWMGERIKERYSTDLKANPVTQTW